MGRCFRSWPNYALPLRLRRAQANQAAALQENAELRALPAHP